MEGRLQTSHRRSEWRFHNPRLQEARRLCSACQTLYIGRHKSFTLATFTSSFNSKSFFFFFILSVRIHKFLHQFNKEVSFDRKQTL